MMRRKTLGELTPPPSNMYIEEYGDGEGIAVKVEPFFDFVSQTWCINLKQYTLEDGLYCCVADFGIPMHARWEPDPDFVDLAMGYGME